MKDGQEVWVDAGCAKALEYFWDHDIDTVSSCEDMSDFLPDEVVAEFAEPIGVLTFPTDDYHRMRLLMGMDTVEMDEDVIAVDAFFLMSDTGFRWVEIGEKN